MYVLHNFVSVNLSNGQCRNSQEVLMVAGYSKMLSIQIFPLFQEIKSKKKIARSLVNDITTETENCSQALSRLNKVWEKSFSERVRNLCIEMIDSEILAKRTVNELPQENAT